MSCKPFETLIKTIYMHLYDIEHHNQFLKFLSVSRLSDDGKYVKITFKKSAQGKLT